MVLLEASGIRKTYPGVVALDHIDLTLEAGKVHILAGENGAGKSTLIKTLAGLVKPDEGTLVIDDENALRDHKLFRRVAYVPQELNLFPYLTVAENMFMPFARSGFGRITVSEKAMEQKAESFIARFGIHARPNQKIAEISVPDQQLLQIARAATQENFGVMILDEPTSSLTARETERLFRIVNDLRAQASPLFSFPTRWKRFSPWAIR